MYKNELLAEKGNFDSSGWHMLWGKLVHGDLFGENRAGRWDANQPPEPPKLHACLVGPLRPGADSVFARGLAVKRGILGQH